MPTTTTTTSIHHQKVPTKKHTHHFFPDHHHHHDDLHNHQVGPAECSSIVSFTISAPPSSVWSLLRRFESPQTYKHFIRSCHLVSSDKSSPYKVGSLREVRLISGIPAVTSIERLETLDEERHVIGFRVVGGEHRLKNYRSVTSLHACGSNSTTVVESYVVDVPEGNSKEDTCLFADTIVKCNLHALARAAEKMAVVKGGRVDL